MTARMKPFMAAVATGPRSNRDLTREEAREVMAMILSGEATPVQAGAFLIALRNKGESPAELAGFVDAIRERAHLIRPRVEGLVDVGSPYDGRRQTWAVGVAASLVAAAAGTPVVLHGSEEPLPPKHGLAAAPVLRRLGIATDLTPQRAARWLEEHGFAFLSARRFVPAVAAFTPLREEVCLRTAFSAVEKIYNLANAPYHLIGLTHLPYLKRLEGALGLLGYRRVFVVQGMEGTEDASTAHATRVIDLSAEGRREIRLDPGRYGLRPASPEDLAGADPETSAAHTVRVLAGEERGPKRDLVLLNAGIRIYLGGRAATLDEGIEAARQAVEGGAALAKLEALRAAS